MAHRKRPADPKAPKGVHFARALPYKTVRNLRDQPLVSTLLTYLSHARRMRAGYKVTLVAPDGKIARRVSEAMTMHQIACRVDALAPRTHVSIRFDAPEVE